MSYTIVRTDGTVLTTIPDGIVNTTSTPLSLPGRNYPGYGQVMDTNFVRALENFADSTLPANAIRGQLFFNTTDDTLYICPSDGESNLSNWSRVLSLPLANLELTDLDASGDITANNAYIDNDVTANHIITNYLTVNVNANINQANIATVAYIGEANTTSITTGTRPTLGNMIGAWTVNGLGTINGVSNTSLWVTGGNLVVTGPGTVGIRTNNYMWANGVPVSFDGTYSNTNVFLYLSTYEGNLSFPGSNSAFNGNLISTGSTANQGTIVGNWTLSPGSQLNGISSIDGANVTGIVGNAQIAQFANTANVANTVALNAQPNITSVGTLTGLNVNGSIVAKNITANTGIFSGDGFGLYNIPIANLVGTFPTIGNATNASQADTANTVRNNAQPNITSTGTLTSLTVSGNAQFTGAVVSLGSNSAVRIFGGGAGQVLATDGSGGLSWTDSGSANTAQTVTNNAQPNITSVGTLSSLSVTGALTAGNIFANSGTVGASLLTGSLTTASQPNITTVGTLTGLNVAGNAAFSGQLVNLGPVSNIRITGGTAGYVLTTDGAGSLSWSSAGAATTAVTVTGNAQPNITSTGALTSLSVTGNVNFTGSSVSLGNIANLSIGGGTAGYVLTTDGSGGLSWIPTGTATTAQTVTNNAQPNITSVGTLSSLSVAGSISAGNIFANSGRVSATQLTGTLTTAAQPNITSIGTLTGLSVSGTASVSGNLSAGNVATGQLTANGNVAFTGANVSLGSVSSVKITGGSPGFVLSTDGSGSLTWISAGSATTAQTVTNNAQPNITSVGTLTSLSVSGNITTTGGRFIGSGLGLTNVPGSSVTGAVANATYATSAGSASTATTAGSASTATTAGSASFATTAETANRANVVLGSAQPNITSLGTLTSLAVSGSLTKGGQNVITPADFTTGGSQTGYTRLPNGLLMQYGTATAFRKTATYISYPIAFSSFSIAVCSGSTQSNGDGSQGAPGVIDSYTTGFTTFFGTDGGGPAITIRWVAIGY